MSMIGKSLIHYEITAEIGKGGMGEVYQAKDTKLGRDVAIKVLPKEFAMDHDRVARFQREAKLLASLNHPNIAAIYGLEESEGIQFLVMELIEGDTLRDRIKSGPIPVEEALKLALQMAEALEAAHEKGVIHRDLKPANIKVTPEGKVKILDFGLAKAYAGDQENLNPLDSPTLSAAATQQGVILGTAAYMSPEQARGKPVDRRADIWAFGVVLYEMLTGKTAFSGGDQADTLAAVIRSEPEWKSLPANLHWRLREVLERCLEKNAKDRYSGISDARVDIQKALADPSGVFVQPVSTVKPRKKLRVGISWLAATLVLGLVIAGVAVWYLKTPEPPEINRFYYELPEGQQFSDLMYTSLAVSPNGRNIVYSTPDGLFLRSIDELDARHISGTKNSTEPFFSPDGQWIGFCSVDNSEYKKIPINGGAPVVLCEVSMNLGANWNKDKTIVYSSVATGIVRVSSNGGTPELLIEPEPLFIASPQILPDEKTLLFTHVKPDGECDIIVQSLESGERKVLFPGATPRYLSTGHIVYGVENNLFAVPFDIDTLDVVGSPVSIVQGVFRLSAQNLPHYAVSDTGTLVYIPGPMGTESLLNNTLVWVDRQGNEEPLEEESGAYSNPQISPDGTQVALSITVDGNEDIYNYDLLRGTKTRLTFDKAADFLPIWTPDGQRIIFCSDRSGRRSIFWKASDGTGKVEEITSVPEGSMWSYSLSRDGNTLFFVQFIDPPSGLANIGMLSMEDDDRTPKLLLHENYVERSPVISPDGRWLAYESNESGQFEIFVRPFPDVDSGGKWQVSTNGGQTPLWSPDCKELFYQSDDTVMLVSVDTDPTFRLGTPKSLFTGPYGLSDISPDGKRFLLMKSAVTTDDESTENTPRRINIVTNWFEELKERVPVD